jgi:hypothetical protein
MTLETMIEFLMFYAEGYLNQSIIARDNNLLREARVLAEAARVHEASAELLREALDNAEAIKTSLANLTEAGL